MKQAVQWKARLQEFDSGSHIYRVGGTAVPSTTQILQATGISPDYSKCEQYTLERKRQMGAALHKCLHFLQQDDLDPGSIAPEIKNHLTAFKQFVIDKHFKTQKVEVRLWPTLAEMRYGMTLDVVGWIDSEPWIIDFKISEGAPQYSWAIQTAAYEHGLGPPVVPPFRFRRASLQLLESCRYRMKEWTDPGDLEEFKWALALTWRRINRGFKLWNQ